MSEIMTNLFWVSSPRSARNLTHKNIVCNYLKESEPSNLIISSWRPDTGQIIKKMR